MGSVCISLYQSCIFFLHFVALYCNCFFSFLFFSFFFAGFFCFFCILAKMRLPNCAGRLIPTKLFVIIAHKAGQALPHHHSMAKHLPGLPLPTALRLGINRDIATPPRIEQNRVKRRRARQKPYRCHPCPAHRSRRAPRCPATAVLSPSVSYSDRPTDHKLFFLFSLLFFFCQPSICPSIHLSSIY